MYVKLGAKAENFSDPLSDFNIARGEVKELNKKQQNSPKIKRALAGGHLSPAQQSEFEKFTGTGKPLAPTQEKPAPKTIDEMGEEELVNYYKENYEITKTELKRFSKLSQEEMLKELQELEEKD